MAPGASKLSTALTRASLGPLALKTALMAYAKRFFTGPGRLKRILVLLFALTNWKNMPFVWTIRIFYTIYYHHVFGRAPFIGPPALFAPVIHASHAPLLEMDVWGYHKNNSTYFTDLDVSRSHLVSHVCRAGVAAAARNGRTGLVKDPATGRTLPGRLQIVLGAVHCSYHREITAYAPYEVWSRILSWDRKWLVILTHFVPRGLARPDVWLDPRFGAWKTSKDSQEKKKQPRAENWEKLVHATAVSKYVFKLDRLTIHPAVILQESGLLPDRPGGWVLSDVNAPAEGLPVANGDAAPAAEPNGWTVPPGGPDAGEWTWQRVEMQRRRGMEYASKFLALDDLKGAFAGGKGPAVGQFWPC